MPQFACKLIKHNSSLFVLVQPLLIWLFFFCVSGNTIKCKFNSNCWAKNHLCQSSKNDVRVSSAPCTYLLSCCNSTDQCFQARVAPLCRELQPNPALVFGQYGAVPANLKDTVSNWNHKCLQIKCRNCTQEQTRIEEQVGCTGDIWWSYKKKSNVERKAISKFSEGWCVSMFPRADCLQKMISKIIHFVSSQFAATAKHWSKENQLLLFPAGCTAMPCSQYLSEGHHRPATDTSLQPVLHFALGGFRPGTAAACALCPLPGALQQRSSAARWRDRGLRL